ncbi:hypothetical protein GOP47_0005446 [Adiantum capillus-veneris]|uniref:Uncharacterized protein n=1 Tax=Adiantum capillus-veneris TaxID=13818 RepID=A0A9D4V5U5_ADICA|nr:hypothetical protein GOP47_0005446 [Adiantum capillus-veneris]
MQLTRRKVIVTSILPFHELITLIVKLFFTWNVELMLILHFMNPRANFELHLKEFIFPCCSYKKLLQRDTFVFVNE